MDKAKENYSIGKQRTVTVHDLEKKYRNTVSSSTKLLICASCGEYVAFVRRDIHQSYFRHGNVNDTTKYCDLRSQDLQSSSIYDRTGLPLYLKKCSNNKFELYVGFYNVDETSMDVAARENYKVLIKSSNGNEQLSVSYLLNDNNFLINSTTLKKIDFISQKYKLEYSSDNAKKLMSPIWGNYIEGILRDGALFTCSENGGRKIKINDEITTNMDYFYLCADEKNLDKVIGIESVYSGEISLKTGFINTLYSIYKINFKALSSESINFCREHLKVSLIYKPSTLIAIWPPSIQRDNSLSFLNKKEAFFILRSEETNARVFLHKDDIIDELKGEEINNSKYLVKIPIISDDIAININEKYNSIFAFLTHYNGNIKTYQNSIYIKDNDNNSINIGNSSRIPINKNIKIIAETKCDILHIKKNQGYQNYKIKNEKGVTIDNLSFGDEIVVINGINRTSLLQYIEIKTQNKDILNDELLYLNLSQLRSPFIIPPIWIKKLLVLLKGNPKTYSIIRRFLTANKMPVNANKVLKDLYKSMNIGDLYEK